ncbi:MAG: FAD-dependent oxidoreductase [Flavobacteriales bacterium]|nr:FAD-dependent oxidoreductase [Flavobacteriales bacterium]
MHSIWEQRSFGAPVHLAVVGAGLVGLWAAVHARRRWPHRRVLVVERGPHPAGASVRNAGFACFGSPSELLADLAAEGEQAALARVAERWQGLLELRRELGMPSSGSRPPAATRCTRRTTRCTPGWPRSSIASTGCWPPSPGPRPSTGSPTAPTASAWLPAPAWPAPTSKGPWTAVA